MVKKLLYEYLQHSDDAERIIKKASFFKGLVKSIEKFEIGLDKHSAKRTDFIHFLTALMKRVEKEKLVVYKIRERKSTFKKIKEAGERE